MTIEDASVAGLQRGLAAEHAAIFAYGVIGPKLPKADRPRAVDAESEHRETRDGAATLIGARGRIPAAAERAYALPAPVTDAASARSLALQVEERVAAAWRAAAGATAGEARRIAVDALAAAAVRAAQWRAVAAPDDAPTVPFPGEPA